MARKFIYYDTETTGINFENDCIIELAAYDPLENRTFEELINTQMPIPAEATAIHNITNEMVADKPNFKIIAEKFIDFCEGEVILIAHNNDRFDLPFLEKEFQKSGLTLPSWSFLDSLKWARRYRPDLPKHSLQHLRETYGFAENNAHRALDDVITLQRVFEAMIDDLSPETVFELLNQERVIQIMPFGKYRGKPLELVPSDYIQWLFKNGALNKKENESLKMSFEKLGLITSNK